MPRKRRAKGSGSIYKAGVKGWCAQRELEPHAGKRRYERRFFAHKRDALAQVAAWSQEAHAINQHALAADTMHTWAERWLIAKAQSVEPGTLRHYRRQLGYVSALIGGVRLYELTPQHIRDMLTTLATSELSPRSRAHVRTILKMCLEMAVNDGIIARNPVNAVDPPKIPKYEATALTPAQLDALYAAAAESRYAILYRFLALYGMRLGEALALRWPDLDRTSRRLRVRSTKNQTERYLPLLNEHLVLLDDQWRRLQMERTDNPQWKEHGLMFPGQLGTPAAQNYVWRMFKIALKRAGLPDIRVHDLRHTAATNLLAAGVDVPTVQYITGHKDPGVLLGIYGHTAQERVLAAIERVSRRGA